MTKIEINDRVYKVHPQYNLYAASEDAEIIHIVKQKPMKGDKKCNSYMNCMVRRHGHNPKRYHVHRFVWECFNGLIPNGKVIDDVNNDKADNRLCNLQLMTEQENCKKSAEGRS